MEDLKKTFNEVIEILVPENITIEEFINGLEEYLNDIDKIMDCGEY